ncbi:tetratricopeptide repeat protein, partial [Arthrospira platensis SPKY1]|nr:tetratricopeptide repeat protein [Arthrospira platensis SPKY1]
LYLVWLLGLTFLTTWAQEEPDAIALAEDQFQEAFFESIKQKGIENYDKAIAQLYVCLSLNESKAVVHQELGRNYLKLKKYAEAETAFQEAIRLETTNKWHHIGLYDVYFQSRQYKKAIDALQSVIPLDDKYKDELVTMYMYTQQYDLALNLIEELRETGVRSEKHAQYKAQILSMSKFKVQEKDRLVDLIKKNPKEEVHYVSLIYLYSQNNEDDKAFEVAKELAAQIPTSDWAHISLFKFHLDKNDVTSALQSFQRVMLANGVDERIRQRMFNEWLVYAVQNQVALDKIDQTIRWMGT